MANNFFSRFPQVEYNMDGRGSFLELTNFVKNVDVDELRSNDSTYYTYHDIQDGERPDTVSYRLYGNPNYYWTFFIINNDLRSGLNSAWPMSLNQLERMMAAEYDPFSVITFMPLSGAINGIANSGLAQLIHLWEAYLPYLRITDESKSTHAKILKYDNSLLQLVVYDIENSDGSGAPNTIDPFLNSDHYLLSWVNPYDPNSLDLSEVTAWEKCDSDRLQFITNTISVYADFDSSAVIDPSYYSDLNTQGEIDAAVAKYYSDYVFGKQYFPAKKYSPARNFAWNFYRDAPSEYYVETEFGNRSVSAYDVITDPNIIAPKYITFFEKEFVNNSRKEKIRVIRPDRITDFVNTYFRVLNG